MSENTKDLQASAKHEVSRLAEQTRPGPLFTPSIDIFETDDAITLLADMPGALVEDLQIDLRDSVLTLTASVNPPESESEAVILREYETGTFFRQFTLPDAIDQSKIDAALANGVLRLVLPKAEAAKPRQIAVRVE